MKIKVFVVALIFLSSCVAYYPQTVDIPLIRKKGDKRIDAGYFLIPDFSGTKVVEEDGDEADKAEWLANAGVNATFSLGITDKMAAQVYASVDGNLRHHLQAALGSYHSLDDKTVI